MTTGTLALLFAARSALQSSIVRGVRAALVNSSVRALLRTSVLGGTPNELILTVYDGLYNGRELVELAPRLVGDALAVPLVAIAMVMAAPTRVATLAALALLAAAAPVLAARTCTARLARESYEAFVPINDDIGDAVGGRFEIVARGRQEAFYQRLTEHIAGWKRVASRNDLGIALSGRAPALAAAAAVGVALAMDAARRGAMDTGVLGTAVLGASAVPAFLGLAKGAIDSARTTVRLQPFLALLDEEPAPSGGPPGAPLPPLPCAVEWSNVSFGYRPQSTDAPRLAIRDVTLSWRPDQVLVLHGPNGSGKSTLIRLLLGLARPTSGQVTVGGQDLFTLDLLAWRREIAYLPQRPYLPERATVRHGVRLLANDVSDDALRDALVRVDLWDALKAHAPADPLDSCVDALSVGERQRLALARILCQPSTVVLLDEPDANLDAAGITLVANLVRDLARTRMVAVAAHTEELVQQGDIRIELVSGARRS
jgi:ABC-type multidrug transport system fused ATPase/permease subunit